jgi:hypothetical protein
MHVKATQADAELLLTYVSKVAGKVARSWCS